MLTWLDVYVRTHNDNVKRELKGTGLSQALLGRFENDLELSRYIVKTMLKTDVEVAKAFALRPEYGEIQLLMAQFVGPYILGWGNNLALQITTELAEDFHGAKAPETDAYMELIRKHDRIYIDLPPGIYELGEGWHLRAIFIWPNQKEVSVLAAIPQAGRLNLDQQIEFLFPFGESIETVPITIHDQDNDRHVRLPVTNVDVQKQVEELVKMALLYYMTQEGKDAVQPLPQLSEKQIAKGRSDKKVRAKLKQASLFKVMQLKSPSGRFGRTNQERIPAGGWKLGQKVPVRGHWKWQAVGPRWSEHRLRWIGPTVRGPKDAPEKPEMHVLKKR